MQVNARRLGLAACWFASMALGKESPVCRAWNVVTVHADRYLSVPMTHCAASMAYSVGVKSVLMANGSGHECHVATVRPAWMVSVL